MKTKTCLLLGAALITLTLAGCATPNRHAGAWEYKIVSGELNAPLQAEINKAAADGWLFVSTASQSPQFGYAVMKRHKE